MSVDHGDTDMRRFAEICELAALNGPVHVAIGVFDGVHLGHRGVISAVVDSGRDKWG